jgi:hypothetical protein
MKGIRIFWMLLLTSILFTQVLTAQKNASKNPVRIGLLLPLLLDSAFDQKNNIKFAPKSFPKYLLPGLEFYEGAMLALDSLNKNKMPVQLVVIDTRAANHSIQTQLEKLDQSPLDIILTHCNAAELRIIATYGLKKNIPVINVNLPNDAGILHSVHNVFPWPIILIVNTPNNR